MKNINDVNEITSKLRDLAEHRKRLAELEGCYKYLLEKFRESNGALLSDLELQRQVLEQTEKEVRELAVECYEQQGDKNV